MSSNANHLIVIIYFQNIETTKKKITCVEIIGMYVCNIDEQQTSAIIRQNKIHVTSLIDLLSRRLITGCRLFFLPKYYA